MSVREYIGARYVPLFIGDWDDTVTYEPLSIVQYQGDSYTSRQYVPAGIEITNETYWACTGNYNAQVDAYRQEVSNLRTDFNNKFPIVTNDISNSAITAGKIADNAITAGKIADNAITTNKIASGAVTTSKIETGAITSEKIADGAIQNIIRLNTNFLTPEMFGALGGSNDDTQAFQDMFDAADNRQICVLTQRQYTIKNTLMIEHSFITVTSPAVCGYTPTITFNNTNRSAAEFRYGITITRPGVSFTNINFNFSTRVEDTYILNYEPESPSNIEGQDCDAIIDNCMFGQAYNHIRICGRNVNIQNCLFSSYSHDAIYFPKVEVSDGEGGYRAIQNPRGLWIHNNRFHAITRITDVDASAVRVVSNYEYRGNFYLVIENNYFDWSCAIYRGITDNVYILNNNYFEPAATNTYPIMFYTTYYDSEELQTVIKGNIFNGKGTGNKMRSMVTITSESIYGQFTISDNVFTSDYTTSQSVIILRGSSTHNSLFTITNNTIKTQNAGHLIINNSNYTTIKGYIANNILSSTNNTIGDAVTAGNLTVGDNFYTKYTSV